MSKVQSEVPDDLIYHYTDQSGLVGIIERREIWATNVSFLNDTSEVSHGVNYLGDHKGELLNALIESRALDSRFSKSYGAVLEYLISKAEERYLLKDPREYLFVSSFFDSSALRRAKGRRVDAGDVLEQWRAYSKGGVGYSIGFDRSVLESQVAKEAGTHFYSYCGGCIYSEDEKAAEAKGILELLKPACDIAMRIAYKDWAQDPQGATHADGQTALPTENSERPRTGGTPKDREAIFDALQYYWGRKMISASLMKNEAFASEHEWRIVRLAFTGSGPVRFRAVKDGILPYSAVSIADDKVSEHLAPGVIRRIVIGPTGTAPRGKLEREARSVKMLLEHHGVEIRSDNNQSGVTIECSTLPC